jgi:hypothetical protein
LLQATGQWLVDEYDDKALQPGWRSSSEFGVKTETYEGLTLHNGELLCAKAGAGFVLPARILTHMAEHLAQIGDLSVNLPRGSVNSTQSRSNFFGTRGPFICGAALAVAGGEARRADGESRARARRARRFDRELLIGSGTHVQIRHDFQGS